MSQNRSTAVMQRRVEAPDSLDYFPTPPWGTRALVEHVLPFTGIAPVLLRDQVAWEPACGEGHMARPLGEYLPFRLAPEFVRLALERAQLGVAVLVRTAFLEGAERYRELYAKTPPQIVAPFTERLPMFKGRLDRHGSTATSYCWLVWTMLAPAIPGGTRLVWIPPCRGALERDSDYPAPETAENGPLLAESESTR